MNNKRSREESLGILRPDLAKEWHPNKNGDLSPFDVRPSSSAKVWWVCFNGKGHEWEATVYARAMGNGCPFCSGHKVSFEESLAVKYPELASQIHPTKNPGIAAEQISLGFRKTIWWICNQNSTHSYEISPKARCKQFDKGITNSCPECNSLQAMYPKLASQWHPTKNLPHIVERMSPGSNFLATWCCEKSSSHEWQQTVKSRVLALKKNVTRGSECPICLNLKATEENCLEKTHPILAKEWDYTRNAEIGLFVNQVTAVSRSKAFWICFNNPTHRWQADIRSRAGTKKKKGSGCSFCTNRKVSHEKSLANTHSQLVKEWHPTKNLPLTPYDISSGSGRKVAWLCQQNATHEWEAVVSSRVSGRGCPHCARWTIERMRLFVKSIIKHIPNLTDAELFALFETSGAFGSAGQAKIVAKAIQSRAVSYDDVIAFSQGKPSAIEEILSTDHQQAIEGLRTVDSTEAEGKPSEEIKPFDALPRVQSRAALEALDQTAPLVSDDSVIKFLVASAKQKIWQHAVVDEEEALKQVKQFKGDSYSEEVRAAFIEEYEGAREIQIPNDFAFKISGKIIKPNLMQRLICFKVLKEKRLGNWSGTGAGKTLSAILASRMSGSGLTVIICPNSVIPMWEKEIPRAFPRFEGHISIKKLALAGSAPSKEPGYRILNYEFFQQSNCRSMLMEFLQNNQVDFLVLDEVHLSKERDKAKVSARKSNISWFMHQIQAQNPNLYVLGMSATPVINNLHEGKTLLEMVRGESFDTINTQGTIRNCMALYQNLVQHGIRFLPRYSASLSIQTTEVDCSELLPLIKQLGKRDLLGLETVLMQAKIPTLLKEIRPKTLIYCHYVEAIIEMIKAAVKNEGYSFAVFTGKEKDCFDKFIKGEVDVLIASRCISTGVDGLQDVCSRILIGSLPWTSAEFTQLIGRVYRQGQPKSCVDVIIPIAFIEMKGERWSYCQTRYDLIKSKKTLADAAVDGVIPEEHAINRQKAYEMAMNWFNRLIS